MNSSALAYLNRLDAGFYQKLDKVSGDSYDNSSLAGAAELQLSMIEEQHQLSLVIQAAVAAAENRQVAQGQFVDRLV